MSVADPTTGVEELRDAVGQRAPLERETAFEGAIFDVVRDRVDLGDAGRVTREYVEHPGAVMVVALREYAGRAEVLVLRQYRHALGITEWEYPAGLLDVDGEAPVDAAARELAEEADLRAERWDLLSGYAPSPGASTEAVRIFLARDLRDVPDSEAFAREGEEADMPTAWVDLDDLHAAVLAGRYTNPGLVVGTFAAHAARAADWAPLRRADTPWPEHPRSRPDAISPS
ncbi:NUDIX domain-containing protein [Agilicoccus flavus]|uniref:NUDIX domain-containing protein n=1 Tax=Agilicoccus flavus TaxID=2775968 RepID=UPI001CF6B093|nr:NUDIX hydrolase [Agilicoccus flavus]